MYIFIHTPVMTSPRASTSAQHGSSGGMRPKGVEQKNTDWSLGRFATGGPVADPSTGCV